MCTTPGGVIVTTNTLFKNYPLRANEETIPTDLIQLEVQNYDIILGMN